MATTREIAIRIVAEMGDFKKSIADITKQLSDLGKAAGTATTRGFKAAESAAKAYATEVDKLAKQESTAANATAQAIVAASKKGTAARLKGIDEVKAATAAEQQAYLKAAVDREKALAASGGKANKATRAADAALADAKVALAKKEQGAWEAVYAKRLQAAKGNATATLALESELAAKVAKLQTSATTAGQTGRRARRGPEAPRGIDRSAMELAENASTISSSLQGGNVAAIGAMLGPWGAAAGIVVDQLGMVIGKIQALGKIAREEDRSIEKLGRTLTEKFGPEGTKGLDILRDKLSALERPAGMSRKALFDLANTAAQFTEPADLPKVVDTLLQLERIKPGTNMAALSQTLNDVADSTGGFTQAADLAASVAKGFRADSLDPLNDAANALGQVLPTATAALGDQGRAAAESAALITGLVQANVSVGDATAVTQKTFKGLTELFKDPATLASMQDKMPAGFDLMSAGMENGEISATKLIDTILKMGPAGQEIANTLGPKLGGEAMNLLANGAANGAASLTSLAAGFGDVEGAAERSANLMVGASERAQAANQQAMADMEANLGQLFTGGLEGAQNAMGGLISTFTTMDFDIFGTMAGPLTLFRDLVVDSGVEFEKSVARFETIKGVGDDVAAVTASLQTMAQAEGVGSIVGQLDELRVVAPESVAQIEAINANLSLTPAEQLRQVNTELNLIRDSTAADTIAALAEVSAAGIDSLREMAGETESWFTSITDAIPDWTVAIPGLGQLVGLAKGLNEVTEAGSLAEQLTASKDATAELLIEYEAVGTSEERQLELAREIGIARRETAELTKTDSGIREKALHTVTAMVEASEAEAKSTGRVFDRTKEIEIAMAGVKDELSEQPEIVADIQARLEAGATSADALKSGLEGAADASEAAVTPVADVATLLAEQGAALEAKGVQMEANNDAEIAGLEATAASNDQILGKMEAQLGLYEAAIKAGQIEEEQVRKIAEAQEEVNTILADRKAAEASGVVTAKASGPQAPTTNSGLAELEGLRNGLKANIDTLRKQNEGIRESVKGMKAESAGRAAGGKAADGAAKSADTLRKAQDDATLSMLDGTAKDAKAAEIARRNALEAAGDDRDAMAAANLDYSTKLREIARKDDEKRAKDREDAAKKADADRAQRAQAAAQADAARAQARDAWWLQQDAQLDAARLAREAELATATAAIATQFTAARAILAGTTTAGPEAQDVRARALRTESSDQVAREQAATALAAIGESTTIRAVAPLAKAIADTRAEVEAFAGGLVSAVDALTSLDPTSVEVVTAALEAARTASVANLDVLRERVVLNEAILAQAADERAFLTAKVATAQDEKDRILTEATAAGDLARAYNLLATARARERAASRDLAEERTGGEAVEFLERRIRSQAEAFGASSAQAQEAAEALREFNAAAGGVEAATNLIDDLEAPLDAASWALQSATDELAGMETQTAATRAATADYIATLHAETEALAGLTSGGVSDALKAALLTLGDTSDEWTAIVAKVEAYRKEQESGLPHLDAHAERLANLTDLDARLGAARVRQADALARGDKEAAAAFGETADEIDRTRMALLAMPEDVAGAAAGIDVMTKNIQGAFARVNSLLEGGINFVKGAIGAKDAGDAVLAGADLVSLVGSTMMEMGAGTPIALVGAVMVGGALIAKAVVEIGRLLEGKKVSQTELAERQVAQEQLLNEILAARLELSDALLAAGDRHLDNAHEQLRLATQTADQKARELGYTIGIQGLDLADVKAKAEAQALALETLKLQEAALKRMQAGLDEAGLLDFGKKTAAIDAAQGAIEGLGYTVAHVRDGIGNVHALIVDANGNLVDTADILDQVGGAIITGTAEQEKWNGLLEAAGGYHDAINAALEEELALLDLREKLGENANAIAAERLDLQRRALNQALAGIVDVDAATAAVFAKYGVQPSAPGEAGSGGLDALAADALTALLDELARMPASQLSGGITDLVTGWLDAAGAAGEYGAAAEDVYDREKTRLGLLKELGRITEDQYKEQMKALLEAHLATIDAQIAEGGTVGDLLDLSNERLQTEIELRDLFAEQNGELDQQDDILVGLVRKRQELLAALRRETGGGTLDASQRAQLDSVTAQAVSRMRDQGATEEQVQAFLDSLPQFEAGGLVPETGPAVLHKGELVIPAGDLTRLLQARSFYNSPEARIITQSATQSAAAAVGGGAMTITINLGGITLPDSWTPAQALASAPSVGRSVVAEIQRAIQSGQLDLRR